MLRVLCMCVPLVGIVAGTTSGYADLGGGTTGGAGGATVTVSTGEELNAALCNRERADTPLTIIVEGTITLGNTKRVKGSSCDTEGDRIQLENVDNVSIIGAGGGALFKEIGVRVSRASNIVLQNLRIRDVRKWGDVTSNGGDAIVLNGNVHHVWIDHCTLEADVNAGEAHDSLIDMKKGTQYVTVSYCVLQDSARCGLMGSSDQDTGNGFVTFHHNIYRKLNRRLPLMRAGTVHSYSNLYEDIRASGISVRAGGRIKLENNYFQDVEDPLSSDGTGRWQVSGNVWRDVTWTRSGEEEAAMHSTTSVSIPYAYTADRADCLKNLLPQVAGTMVDLKTSDGNCGVPTPPPLPQTISSGVYRLESRYLFAYALEVKDGSTSSGANVQMGEWTGSPSQLWKVKSAEKGWYKLVNQGTGKALSVEGESDADGANLVQYTYDRRYHQQWKLTSVGGRYVLINRGSTKRAELVRNNDGKWGQVVQKTSRGFRLQQEWIPTAIQQ
eukprot:TRINITY_DN13620_c0_g1_i1.p1 TRINITY_DN13620_c0_g1~~TRINITY_DN13620_c0_g1_i1.p1  ORF type:complete len:498 (+),score=124.88 TRINITY_DN13620_c0_g1_i1:92-1585(+)